MVHRRRPVAVLALVLGLALPVLVTAAPAKAAGSRTRPAAVPGSDLLSTLGDLLARLLPIPPAAVPGVAPATVAQATASTVRVNGVACGVHLAGSGFTPAPDTVVTNAHVVAGVTGPTVLRPDGRTLPATVTAFDPAKDIAVLSVPGLGEPSLPVGSAVTGESDAVIGHPLGQAAVSVKSAQVARRVTADIGDIYDRPAGPRQLLVLLTELRPGDSGSPLVNRAGQVVGVAFAASNLRPTVGYAVASEDMSTVLARPRAGAVGTGPCID